jgi:peroxiredoxin
MKRFCYILLTLALVSCGAPNGQFKIEGRFLNLNRGEFYVYSTDGLVNGVDTIHTDGGRFSYQIPCEHSGTLMLVFPNFSEQPIFAESGKTAHVKGDATHLKEMSVEGTDANELMTRFRQAVVNASPPEAVNKAALFIRDNAASPVSVFLLKRYFLQGVNPDLTKAAELLETLVKAQPKNGEVNRLMKDVSILKIAQLNAPVPSFSAVDINGRTVTNADLRGKVSVIHVWSTWNYESQDIQRRLRSLREEKGSKLGVVGICIDASKRDCRNYLKHDSVGWSTICDEQMLESPLLAKLGMMSVPDNIIIDTSGRIIARGLNPNDMRERLEKLLK